MIVNYFNIPGVSGVPPKTYSPLLIDPNAVLPPSLALERFQLVIRRHPQFFQFGCGIQHPQLTHCRFLNRLGELPRRLPMEQFPCLFAFERFNHGDIVTRGGNSVKRYYMIMGLMANVYD